MYGRAALRSLLGTTRLGPTPIALTLLTLTPLAPTPLALTPLALAPLALTPLALSACDPSDTPCGEGCAAPARCVNGDCVAADAGDTDAGDSGPDEPGPGEEDAGANDAPTRPAARWPLNGAMTGSVHGSVVLPEPALRPVFDWDDVAGASRYELEVTDECRTPGFADCRFETPALRESVSESELRAPLLDVDVTPPVGRRYYWRVRACSDACSAWTPVRYVDVGRQPNDFDGDGYADVLAGAYLDDGGADRAGRAYWWPGGSGGPGEARAIGAPVAEAEGRFGLACAALGDVNADGFADALISAYRLDRVASDAGEAYVYLGGPDGLPPAPDLTLSAPVAESGAQFGRDAGPAGDLDADGFADLLVSAHAQDAGMTNLGRAYAFRGGADGVDPSPLTLSAPGVQDNAQFGFPLVGAGDVDGDGHADVLVGERLWDGPTVTDRGRAHLFAGSSQGLVTPAALSVSDPSPSEGAELSWNLTGLGDVDGDRFVDVLVAARRRQGRGGALLFLGGPRGPAAAPDAVLDNPDAQDDAEFGFGVGPVGDVNGDGRPDLVVGARLHDHGLNENAGRVYVYYGREGTFANPPDLVLNGVPRERGAQLGYSVGAARDVDGDGVDDVVVGAPNQDLRGANHGAVYFYRGGIGGLSPTPELLGTARADGRLGSCVARVLPY